MYYRNDAPIQDIWNDPDERFGEVPPDGPDAGECVWCRESRISGADCGAVEPMGDGYECTRMRGHTGKHVACGGSGSHKLAIWE